ncbi:MAG: alkaline phosphatase D family protein [Deltaproteobacteria bacterium]|nr:alkaline phosphatase D family protein [Deltaproteobacteria bacterium]
MTWTRRQMLEMGAKAGLLGVAPVAVGCPTEANDDDSALDDGWPALEPCDPEVVDYEYTGTPGPEDLFSHGVASGDPLADSLILWTRVTPGSEADVEVYWEVSQTSGFDTVYASGITTTNADRDYTVKVESTCLAPATTYYYRFQSLGRTSVIGRTRTASYGPTASKRFAFCSCSSMPHGYFHAYRAIGERADLEAVLHLGDYIYEYGNNEYGDVRDVDPPYEIVTLSDYRRRHAFYKLDEDLQEAHRQHPWICTWDDHETANNSFSGGAQNHNTGEGDWDDRKEAGRQAYFEWLPIREGNEGRLYRQFLTDDLLDIIVLDTRIEGRDEEGSTVDQAYAEDRQLLGEEQENWLFERLSSSPSRWKLLAQQVVMGQWSLAADDEGRPRPLNYDAWDGYQAARRRLLERVVGDGVDGLVVLTGDVHSSWANDIALDFPSYIGASQEGSVAVEAVCPGITSPGAGGLSGALQALNPHIRWGDSGRRGFVLVDATQDALQCDWYLMDDGSIEQSDFVEPTVRASYRVIPGDMRWVEASAPISGSSGPPLAP